MVSEGIEMLTEGMILLADGNEPDDNGGSGEEESG
jgi:hypothetical protein